MAGFDPAGQSRACVAAFLVRHMPLLTVGYFVYERSPRDPENVICICATFRRGKEVGS